MSLHCISLKGRAGPPLIGLFVVITVLSAIFLATRKFGDDQEYHPGSTPREESSAAKNRQTQQIGFVGSESCRECHSSQCADWQLNPMSHSTTRVADRLDTEDYAVAKFSPSPHVEYSVEKRDGRVFHHERMTDRQSSLIFDQSVEISYVIGSGQQGHAYLIERPGMLYASPVNWYSKSHRWGLAPGYDPAGHQRFERRVSDGCLNCHAGRIADDPENQDRFVTPVFREISIGCERCHGPGEQHIAHHRNGVIADMIINPSSLELSARDAVCAQCHLQGVERVLRKGRTDFDFRPGELLGDTWTIFVDQSSLEDKSTRAVSHVEQMRASVCCVESKGRMSCTTCHDPHSTQHGTESSEFYRRRCLTCHSDDSCSAPAAARSAEMDACTACHMPAISASDVPHAAHTNHRILRNPNHSAEAATPTISELAEFQEGTDTMSDAERQRATGIALARLMERGAIARSTARAEAMLRKARLENPEDPELLESLGVVLNQQNRSWEAAGIWKQGLLLDPDNEALLSRLAQLTHDSGDFEQAAGYLERFLTLNPWHAGIYGRHAHVMGKLGRFPEGIRSAQKSLKLDPSLAQVRGWLVDAYLAVGDREASENEKRLYDRLIEVAPLPDAPR